jgi:hypothetical protein
MSNLKNLTAFTFTVERCHEFTELAEEDSSDGQGWSRMATLDGM